MVTLEKLKKLPDTPGIYLFYAKNRELIYVGKATSLKNRVRSYFIGKKTPRPIEEMIHQVADIQWQTTESVLEAIILEANTIKKFQPKYNVIGKDDKSWNYIVITDERYPRVKTLRQHEYKQTVDLQSKQNRQNKLFANVFGPYPGLNTKAAMKLLRQMFRYSTCQKKNAKFRIQNAKLKPCFYYQLGQCLGVCTGEITPKEYRHRVIRPLVLFLKGKKKELVRALEREMRAAVKTEAYEEAGRLRDQVGSLQRIHDIALLNTSFVSDLSMDDGLQTTIGRGLLTVHRIEGYDISNLGATGKVGSMVVFINGQPDKKEYRKFKIKHVDGQSDVDCLEEVLRRRLNHSEWALPDVFLVDGGLPQVNRVKRVLKDLKIFRPLVGIAKGRERKRNDFIFGERDRGVLLWVMKNKPLLISVRDEAHRFAITYQKKLRKIKG